MTKRVYAKDAFGKYKIQTEDKIREMFNHILNSDVKPIEKVIILTTLAWVLKLPIADKLGVTRVGKDLSDYSEMIAKMLFQLGKLSIKPDQMLEGDVQELPNGEPKAVVDDSPKMPDEVVYDASAEEVLQHVTPE